MADTRPPLDGDTVQQVIDRIGLAGFVDQVAGLQGSLARVAEGMQAVADNAVKQRQDTENLAAHILAIEAVLTVILRQIPLDIAEVREEALRRTRHLDHNPTDGPPLVVQLAEDIVRRADD